eukprot:640620_1
MTRQENMTSRYLHPETTITMSWVSALRSGSVWDTSAKSLRCSLSEDEPSSNAINTRNRRPAVPSAPRATKPVRTRTHELTEVTDMRMSPINAQRTFARQAYGDQRAFARRSRTPLKSVTISCKSEKDFEIVLLTCDLLYQHGNIPIGLLGTLLHRRTQDHGLPSYFKEMYGGLKKFISQFSTVFSISSDHRFNPSIGVRAWPHSEKFAGHAPGKGASTPPVVLTRALPLATAEANVDGVTAMGAEEAQAKAVLARTGYALPSRQRSRRTRSRRPRTLKRHQTDPGFRVDPGFRIPKFELGPRASANLDPRSLRIGPRSLHIDQRSLSVTTSPEASPRASIFEFSSPFSPRMPRSLVESEQSRSYPLTSRPASPASLSKAPSIDSISSLEATEIMQSHSDQRVPRPSAHGHVRGGRQSCGCCGKMSYIEDRNGRTVMSPGREFVSLDQFFSSRRSNPGASPPSPLRRVSWGLDDMNFSDFSHHRIRQPPFDVDWFENGTDMPALPGLASSFVPSKKK